MLIKTKTKKMGKIFGNADLLVREYGKQIGRKIQQRLLELKAADTLEDISHLPPSKLHILTGNYQGCFAVKLTGNYRLIFKAYTANEEHTIQKVDTKIIIIEEVVDYHGN